MSRQLADEPVWDEELEVLAPHVGIDEVPPPAETLFYAWQHTLVDVSPFVLPLVVARAVGYDDGVAAGMISTCLTLMGLLTFVNATWGHRLPSVMGPSATNTGAMAAVGSIYGASAMWMAAFVGGLFEAAVGASGVLRSLRRLLPPYVCGIVVLTIGLTLGRIAAGWVLADPRPAMLSLAAATATLVLLLNLVGHRWKLKLLARGSILFSLLGCGVVGATLLALVDFAPLRQAPWLGFPTFLPFGGPGIGWPLVAGAVAGALAGYVGSIAESIGDYAGTCAVSGVSYRLRHIRRGLTVEGLGSALATLFGAIPLTTYSQNTGVIATTRVASRRVVQVAAGILTLYGLCPKTAAVLVLIPRPVVGVVFLVVCGMISAAGLRLLALAPRDEAALLTTSVSLIVAVTVPPAAAARGEWLSALDPSLRLLLTNAILLATLLAVGLNGLMRTTMVGGVRPGAAPR